MIHDPAYDVMIQPHSMKMAKKGKNSFKSMSKSLYGLLHSHAVFNIRASLIIQK